jgi:hypothetical protein
MYDPIGSQGSFLAYNLPWFPFPNGSLCLPPVSSWFFGFIFDPGDGNIRVLSTSVDLQYQTTRRYTSEDSTHYIHHCKNLTFNTVAYSYFLIYTIQERIVLVEKIYLKILVDFHVFDVAECKKPVSGMPSVCMSLCIYVRLAIAWTV